MVAEAVAEGETCCWASALVLVLMLGRESRRAISSMQRLRPVQPVSMVLRRPVWSRAKEERSEPKNMELIQPARIWASFVPKWMFWTSAAVCR